MNFFEHQDRAKGTTRKLVLLFSAAVASLIAITTVLLIVALTITQSQNPEAGFEISNVRSDIALGVSVVVLLVVLLGAMFRMTQLRGGGKAVAESLGGRLLNMGTRDADERKMLNVVEEMSIAAGLPVPQVYLLEDPAINAFAAGFHPQDAVIGVTRGCIAQLSRDELQGVVAHEFSHIFNGDMRLNIRLIGWLYGITVIGLIGYYLMRGQTYRMGGRDNNSRAGALLVGVGLIVVGYGGTFFGNLIKAAVSRQREFLADASAVQFTRNPASIGGALKKIGGFSNGSLLSKADASEFSHLLFGQGVKAGFAGLFATHPPLEERIRRVEPGWDGKFIVPETFQASRKEEPPQSRRNYAGAGIAAVLIDNVGEPDPDHLRKAGEQIMAIPAPLIEALHSTLGACLAMHCLIISSADQQVSQQQFSMLKEQLKPAQYQELVKLHELVKSLPRTLYLPVIELAIPALRQLSGTQFQAFMSHLHQLMQADGQISLFEWCLFRILRFHLHKPQSKGVFSRALQDLEPSINVLYSALASAGSTTEAEAKVAFKDAFATLGLKGEGSFSWSSTVDLKQLDSAFDKLLHLAPLQKPRLLKGMVRCVEHDGIVTADEVELIRTAAAILDCPMPPLTLPVSQPDAESEPTD